MVAGVEFGLLGPLVVRSGGELVEVPQGKQRALLAALLLKAGRMVPVDEIAWLLWGAEPPVSARVTVQNYVKRLRQVLGDGARDRIVTHPGGYSIRVMAGELDVSQFEMLVVKAGEAARDGSWERARADAAAALSLWRGEPLADVPGTLTAREAPRLAELRLQVMEARLEAEVCLGGHAWAVPGIRRLATAHPLREHIHVLLMMALYRSGRQAEALAVYANARRVLADELGIEPGVELRELHKRILAADPALTVPGAAAGTTSLAPKPRTLHLPALVIPRQLPGTAAHFTGRVVELKTLARTLDESIGQAPGTLVIVAISGTAGVGKTALAVHWAHQVVDEFPDGQLYVNLRGFDPSGSPVGSAEAIRTFLVALGIPAERIPQDLAAQAALYRSLLADRQMLIVLDNARDEEQIRPLLSTGPGCFVLVTSRNILTGMAAAEGACLLMLDVLAENEARNLLARRLGADRLGSEPGAAEELAALCAGLPLALAIVAGRAAARPGVALAELATELRDTNRRLDALEAGDQATSPRAVFSWSCRQLSAPGARMFRLLGLHPGPDITSAAAASLAAIPPAEASRILDELARAHLLIEHARGRFAFHDLLRAYAAEQARDHDSTAERRTAEHRLLDHYLHTAYAASRPASPTRRMISLPEPQPGVSPERFAGHQDALAWLDAEYRVSLAAASLAADSGFDIHAWQLPWMLARFQQRRGYWHERVDSQQAALAAAQRLDDPVAQARTHYELALAYNHIGCDKDIVHGKLAYELFRQLGNSEAQGLTLGLIGRTLERQGRWREALEYAQRYLELCQEAGNRFITANALNAIGWCCAHLGDYQRARDCCEQAIAVFLESGDLLSTAWTSDTLGYTHYRAGDHAEAAARYREALCIYQEVGDRPEHARTLVRLGDVHDTIGDRNAARAAWQEALDIFDELQLSDAREALARLADLGPV
jgi:DNA-binding SARP family transcriptional activator/tetratricopeptide (TPR) repeat protein